MDWMTGVVIQYIHSLTHNPLGPLSFLIFFYSAALFDFIAQPFFLRESLLRIQKESDREETGFKEDCIRKIPFGMEPAALLLLLWSDELILL